MASIATPRIVSNMMNLPEESLERGEGGVPVLSRGGVGTSAVSSHGTHSTIVDKIMRLVSSANSVT